MHKIAVKNQKISFGVNHSAVW